MLSWPEGLEKGAEKFTKIEESNSSIPEAPSPGELIMLVMHVIQIQHKPKMSSIFTSRRASITNLLFQVLSSVEVGKEMNICSLHLTAYQVWRCLRKVASSQIALSPRYLWVKLQSSPLLKLYPIHQLTHYVGRLRHTMSVMNKKTLVVCGGVFTANTCILWSKDSPDNVWEFFALLRSLFQ